MDKSLFQLIMEADEDLQAFDDVPADNAGTEETTPTDPDTADAAPVADDTPPPVDDTAPAADDDLVYDDSTDPGIVDGGDDTGTGEETAQNEADPESLSEKASNILNQKLYRTFVIRNKEVEDILDNLQTIVPVLPYEIVDDNQVSVTRLRTALTKGQKYVIDNFVDAKYGENLSYFNKLDMLYRILLDTVNTNLRKVHKST